MSSSTLNSEVKNTYLGKTMLSTSEALQFLSISESMLDKLCSNGVIPYYNGTDSEGNNKGRKRFFLVDDLIKWQMSYYTPSVSVDIFPKSVRKAS
ncbi:helix-turn-helix domain-containing protein [Flavobacteriaceae bacterium]|jgi:hypothetical protein|nr:helix-turn-helix domain-containing protein [Flavobacteriaceae bacterium]MDC1056308.1 helix-turn-helix domain-containing protein [Flavobacteriaceae bacterium]